MSKIDLGKVAITCGGIYDPTRSFEALTYVLNSHDSGGDGCGYISLKATIGVAPGTDPTTWQKASEAGLSLYQLAVLHGYEGTEEEFVQQYNTAVQAAADAAAAALEAKRLTDLARTATEEATRLANAAAEAAAEATRLANAAEVAREQAEAARVAAENDREHDFSVAIAAANAAAELADEKALLAAEKAQLADDKATLAAQKAAVANLAAEAALSAAATANNSIGNCILAIEWDDEETGIFSAITGVATNIESAELDPVTGLVAFELQPA